MKAREATDGQVYNLLGKGQRPQYKNAVCSGWNHSHEWILFIVQDDFGKRKVTLLMPEEEIEPYRN